MTAENTAGKQSGNSRQQMAIIADYVLPVMFLFMKNVADRLFFFAF